MVKLLYPCGRGILASSLIKYSHGVKVPVVVFGINHEHAPLDLVEKVALSAQGMEGIASSITKNDDVYESIVLSTCLRTEIYAVTSQFHETIDAFADIMTHATGIDKDLLDQYLEVRFDDNALQYLFEVAAGLRSAVPGETEVLGQVRRALNDAIKYGTAGPILRSLFQHAIAVGREVRLSTAIAQGTTSFAHIAAELIASNLQNNLSKSKIVIIGAGEMGEGVATVLANKYGPLHELIILSRTPQKARDLADRITTNADQTHLKTNGAGMANLPEQIMGADAIVVSVTGNSIILNRSTIETALSNAKQATNSGRQMLIIDLGMPKNVDPLVADLEGISLFNMGYIINHAQRVLKDRRDEYEAAGKIIEKGIDTYHKNQIERGATPVVTALRDKIESIRNDEIAKARSRHGNNGLGNDNLSSTHNEDDKYWEDVDRITKRIVAKILHQPTISLKESMGTPRGAHLIEAVRDLFDL